MAIGACSPDHSYYACISDDGRLRVYNTETSALLHEYTPNLHLSAAPQALTWITLGLQNATKKSRKRQSNEPNISCEQVQSDYVALGTPAGSILLYSIAHGKLHTVLEQSGKGSKSSICCLDWEADYGLYSASADNYVSEWDVTGAAVKHRYNCSVDGKNKAEEKIKALIIVPNTLDRRSRLLVTASFRLHLWSLSPLTLLRTMIGHSGPITMLARADFVDKCYVASCTKSERLVSVWDVSVTHADVAPPLQNGDSGHAHKTRSGGGSVVVSPVRSLLLEDAPIAAHIAADTHTRTRHVAVVTRSGVMHYYHDDLNGVGHKPLKPRLTLHVSTEDACPLPMWCAELTRLEPCLELLIGYRASPAHLVFERVAPKTNCKTQVLIRAAAAAAAPTPAVVKTRSDKQHPVAVTYATPTPTLKRNAPGGKVEVAMESRLSNLQISNASGSVHQNLTKLLVQGLHSNDKTLIQTVLGTGEPGVAARTLANLPAEYVPALLQQLSNLAAGSTHHCKAVCVWLPVLLRLHAAILIATLNTNDKLQQLLAIITQRRSHLCQLLNLKGRLELTISQRSSEKHDLDTEPVLDYADTSESEPELELASDDDTDDGSWHEQDDNHYEQDDNDHRREQNRSRDSL